MIVRWFVLSLFFFFNFLCLSLFVFVLNLLSFVAWGHRRGLQPNWSQVWPHATERKLDQKTLVGESVNSDFLSWSVYWGRTFGIAKIDMICFGPKNQFSGLPLDWQVVGICWMCLLKEHFHVHSRLHHGSLRSVGFVDGSVFPLFFKCKNFSGHESWFDHFFRNCQGIFWTGCSLFRRICEFLFGLHLTLTLFWTTTTDIYPGKRIVFQMFFR